MTVQIDLRTIEGLILRNCRATLTELGFNFEEGADPIDFDYALNDADECVGIRIHQGDEN